MIRGLIGVIHLPPLPGDPLHEDSSFAEVEQRALADAAALAEGGADALLVENFGSVPFAKEQIEPHQVAAMALYARQCAQRFDLPVGINCLRNDARSAIGIAAAAQLAFVRVNVHTGAYVTDQGLIEGRADETLRYRQRLGVRDSVRILADVMVKHAAPLGALDIGQAAADCLGRGCADGVIITGAATGAGIAPADLERVRAAIGEGPLYLGSGVTPELAPTLAPLADGAIVGTWIKRGGQLHAPVDAERVGRLADILKPLWRTQ